MGDEAQQVDRSRRMDNVLKGSAALALLIASGSAGYYYAIFLPQRSEARDIAAQHELADKARNALEKVKKDEVAAKRRRDGYKVCISTADFSYSNRWDASCKINHERDVADRSRCLNNGVEEASCVANYPIRPETDCTLPGTLANDYDKDRQEARGQCRAEATSDLTP